MRHYSLFGSETRTYTVNQILHYWDYQELGNRWKFYWNAEGSGDPVEISIGLTSSIKAKLSELIEANISRNFTYKKQIRNGSQKIDEKVTNFCDQQSEINGVHTIEGAVLHFSLTTE